LQQSYSLCESGKSRSRAYSHSISTESSRKHEVRAKLKAIARRCEQKWSKQKQQLQYSFREYVNYSPALAILSPTSVCRKFRLPIKEEVTGGSNLISIAISPAPAYAKMKAAEYPIVVPFSPVTPPPFPPSDTHH